MPQITPEQIRSELATPHGFRAWLRSHNRGSMAGLVGTTEESPFARYCRSLGLSELKIFHTSVSFTLDQNEKSFLAMPQWAQEFDLRVQTSDHRTVSFGRCLSILKELTGKLSAA